MFAWYREARVCYVYLEDVPHGLYDAPLDLNDVPHDDPYNVPQADHRRKLLENAKWFTRGWTLQELLAPSNVKFYGREWAQSPDHVRSGSRSVPDYRIGDKSSLGTMLSQITGIDVDILHGTLPINHASVAQRMFWASTRLTTRLEDQAYCLMGIFDVNMPLLYGERHKAFLRLQEEIMKQDDDQSLFAWTVNGDADEGHGLLADSPSAFARSRRIKPYRSLANIIPRPISSNAVSVALSLLSEAHKSELPPPLSLGVLECYEVGKLEQGRPAVYLMLVNSSSADNHYTRMRLTQLHWVHHYTEPTEIFVRQLNMALDRPEFTKATLLHFNETHNHVAYVYADGSRQFPPEASIKQLFTPQSAVNFTSQYSSMAPRGEHSSRSWKGVTSGGLYELSPRPSTLSAVILFVNTGSDNKFLLLLGTQPSGEIGFETREPSQDELERMSRSAWPPTYEFKPNPSYMWMELPGVHVMVTSYFERTLAPGIKYLRPTLHIRQIKSANALAMVTANKSSTSSRIKQRFLGRS